MKEQGCYRRISRAKTKKNPPNIKQYNPYFANTVLAHKERGSAYPLEGRSANSPASVFPPRVLPKYSSSIFAAIIGEASMEYNVINTNIGEFETKAAQASKSSGSILSSFQSSPLGPLPKAGGSKTIASYFTPLRTSRLANFKASSTIHRIGLFSKPLAIWFLLAH